MKQNIRLCILVLFAGVTVCRAQDLKLIPAPQQVIRSTGHYPLKSKVLFTPNRTLAFTLKYFNAQLAGYGLAKHRTGQLVHLNISSKKSSIQGAYELNITTKGISIIASDTAGIQNGLVTLLQICLFSEQKNDVRYLPCLTIRDKPRFAWRGVLLDESRHFFGKAVVEQLLDWMAFYKLNKFHWHLTDANGWRIEIKHYPLLTKVGGRGNYSDSLAAPSYYSQQDIREIVDYAKIRGIAIIPEIDMPGHATAATRAYPYLSGGVVPRYPNFTFNPANEKTYVFLGNVIKEISGLFPSGMTHIGGDEVALGITAWNHNNDVLQLMSANNLTDVNAVEQYFLRRMADTVIKLHNNVLCWDEAVTAGLSPQHTIIDWWRQDKPESLNQAVRGGYRVILCPRLPLYLDFVQDSTNRSGRKWGNKFSPYLDIYHFPDGTIADSTLSYPRILGIQANLWTEKVVSVRRLQYLYFPRIAALAGSAWEMPVAKNAAKFNLSLQEHLKLYDKAGIYYYSPFSSQAHPEPVDIPVPDQE